MELETNQKKLREMVLSRCQKQSEVCHKIGINQQYFNSWIKGHKDAGMNAIYKINLWLSNG